MASMKMKSFFRKKMLFLFVFFVSFFLFSQVADAANIAVTTIESSGNASALIVEGKDFNGYYDYYTLTQLLKQESFATGVNMDTTATISDSITGKPIWARTTTTLSTGVVNGATAVMNLNHTALSAAQFEKAYQPIEYGHYQGSSNFYEIRASWDLVITSDFLAAGSAITATLSALGNASYYGEAPSLYLFDEDYNELWSWFGGEVTNTIALITGEHYILGFNPARQIGTYYNADNRDLFTAPYGDDEQAYSIPITADFKLSVSEGNDPNSVPEPATMLLFGLGLMGLAAIRKNKR